MELMFDVKELFVKSRTHSYPYPLFWSCLQCSSLQKIKIKKEEEGGILILVH